MNINEEIIEQLILEGAVEFSGLDARGNILFNFTNKIEEIAPNIYKYIQAQQMQDINELWVEGYVMFDDLTSEHPMIAITEKALDKTEVDKLDIHKRVILEQLISMTSE